MIFIEVNQSNQVVFKHSDSSLVSAKRLLGGFVVKSIPNKSDDRVGFNQSLYFIDGIFEWRYEERELTQEEKEENRIASIENRNIELENQLLTVQEYIAQEEYNKLLGGM